MIRLLALAALLVAPLEARTFANPLDRLARAFAPVLRQDTAGPADLITAIDFDGNWYGDDNWENQPSFPAAAVVYWAGVETSTHIFLTYAWFHPRDVERPHIRLATRLGGWLGVDDGEHENDLEGCMVTLTKRDGRAYVAAVETVFHLEFRRYLVDPGYQARGVTHGRIPFEGTHPIVKIESHGHGADAWDGEGFPGGDGVVYRVGDEAGVPQSLDEDGVPYALVPIETTLWPRRFDMGERQALFAPHKTLEHGAQRIGFAFLGYDRKDHAANAPWGWTDSATDLPQGTHFFDPAAWFQHQFSGQEVARDYLQNPYAPRAPSSLTVGAALPAEPGLGVLGN